MSLSDRLTGQLTAPTFTLPAWAIDRLDIALWDRDEGPDHPITGGPLSGPTGQFNISLGDEAAMRLSMVGHRDGPQHLATVGWGADLDPVLGVIPWPGDWATAGSIQLAWRGTPVVLGFVEALHLQEIGGLPLVILEVTGRCVPFTYQRLPDLPLPALGDRHGLHVDRHLDDSAEQVYYILADADSPLAAVAQDALVSGLRVVCTTSLGPQEGGWHEIVNIPLLLDQITLLAP